MAEAAIKVEDVKADIIEIIEEADLAVQDTNGDTAMEDVKVETETEEAVKVTTENKVTMSLEVKEEGAADETEPAAATSKAEDMDVSTETYLSDYSTPVTDIMKKLKQITVSIGPIKQQDLLSPDLHKVLQLNANFEIKFEQKEVGTHGDSGKPKNAKLGYVKIPFVIRSPRYLVLMADRLGNLRIDGRDMSVQFPDEFNKAVEVVRKEVEEVKKRKIEERKKNKEDASLLKRKTLYVHNIPEKTDVETLKSLFPEVTKVTLPEVTKGATRYAVLEFKTPESATECIVTNKDVQIEDCKVRIVRVQPNDSGQKGDNQKNKDQPKKRNRGGKPAQKRPQPARGWSNQVLLAKERQMKMNQPGRGRVMNSPAGRAGKGAMGRGGSSGRGNARNTPNTGMGLFNNPMMMRMGMNSMMQGGMSNPMSNMMGMNMGGFGMGAMGNMNNMNNMGGMMPGSGGGGMSMMGMSGQNQKPMMGGGGARGMTSPRSNDQQSNRFSQNSNNRQNTGNQNSNSNNRQQKRARRRSRGEVGQSPGMQSQGGQRQSRWGQNTDMRPQQDKIRESPRKDDDTIAMMAQLKSQIAKMEEKLSSKTSDRDHSDYRKESSPRNTRDRNRSSSYSRERGQPITTHTQQTASYDSYLGDYQSGYSQPAESDYGRMSSYSDYSGSKRKSTYDDYSNPTVAKRQYGQTDSYMGMDTNTSSMSSMPDSRSQSTPSNNYYYDYSGGYQQGQMF